MLNMLDQNYTKLGNSMNGRGNFFCAAPWATLYYHGNKASVCHARVDKFEMGPREFLDSDYLKNLKKQFINGEVPSNCISCVIKENMSLKSTRQAILGYLDKNKIPLSDFTVETSSKIIRLELRANNLCNFKCRFCNSENSSLIEEEHEIYPILEQYNPNRLKDEKKTYDINLTELKNLALTNLKVLCITGGEPFLIKSYYDYMDFLIEQDVSKNITLEIYTNCSVYNPKFIERMLKFGQVNFVMSLDGVGKSASYINLSNKVDKFFVYQLLQTNFIKSYFNNELTGSTIKNLGLSSIRNTPSPIPPSLAEQTAIATALSDADGLITGLEKLIAKKRNIKQGAMQQLLQPKEGWEVKKLGEISQIYTGKKNNQDKVENGKYPFFVRSKTIESINSYSFDGEAILIPGEGNIGSIFHYINGKFDYHQRVYKISDFNDKYSGKYIYRYITEHFGKHAMQNSVKATVDSLRLPTFQVFEIPFPPSKEEQTRIATILSDMDTELSALEQKLEKYKKVKLGMMQELLTGKTRLV